VFGQKLSVAIQINQGVKRFLFLILKRSIKLPPPSAPKTLATAAERTSAENQHPSVRELPGSGNDSGTSYDLMLAES
jgi:hypothetical protein